MADNEGARYEKILTRVLKNAIKDNKDINLLPARRRSASDSNSNDITLKLFNSFNVNIELKLNARAQMGGGSYNMKDGKYVQTKTTQIDKITDEEYIKILETKRPALNRLLKFVKDNDIDYLSERVGGLPVTATDKVWEKAKTKGLLVPLNTYVKTPTTFVYDHYAKKNCYYIQIGGRGLYYLKSNPLNLPIPQLTGNLTVELRLGPSGARLNSTYNKVFVGANIRAQGRLGGDYAASPYDLENPEHYPIIFGKLSKEKAAVMAGL